MLAPQPPSTRAPFPRRTIFGVESFVALPLSIALHLVVLYVVAQTSWPVSKPERDTELSVVWLQERLPPEEDRAEVPPVESPEELENSLPDKPPVAETEVVPEDPDPPAEHTAEEPPSPDIGAEPGPADPPRTVPPTVEQGPDPSIEAAEDESLPRALDWEEARRHMIDRMREEREREDGFLTFSRDPSIEESPGTGSAPAAPTPKPWPPCPVVNRRAIQLMMVTVGMCFRTRDVRSDLFSNLRPDSSKWRPVCAPVIDADGKETYKCLLVIDEE